MFNQFDKYKALIISIFALFLLSSCSSISTATQAEKLSGYTYIPIDPLPVSIESSFEPCSACTPTSKVMQYFPDNTVRIYTEEIDSEGNISYNTANVIKADQKSYRVVIDYIASDVYGSFTVWIAKQHTYTNINGTSKTTIQALGTKLPERTFLKDGWNVFDKSKNDELSSTSYNVLSDKECESKLKPNCLNHYTKVTIPVYVGAGLRITSNIQSLEGNVNISGLSAIGFAADAKQLSGSLVVQTLGVQGKEISSKLPIQSKLSIDNVQSAITNLTVIKEKMHEGDKSVAIHPRIVGIYLPIKANQKLVNAIVSKLSETSVVWKPSVLYYKE